MVKKYQKNKSAPKHDSDDEYRAVKVNLDDIEQDEVDQCKFSFSIIKIVYDQREKVMLGEDESEDDEVFPGEEDEEVMGLEGVESDDSDSEESEEEEEWGEKKHDYYDADSDADEEEEKEALKIQKQRLESFEEEDFNEEEDEEEEEVEDDTFGSAMKQKQDINKISKQEKIDMLQKEAPELLSLFVDFKKYLGEIRNTLEPLMTRVKNGEIQTSKGLSFLEVKYQLLLSYCTNISFYLLLKARGKRVKDHPVIDRLVELRIILEKMKPMEMKLKYQIDKILKSSLEKNDPLQFKANVDNLEVNEEESEKEENQVYKAPKIAPMHFNDKTTKEEKKERLMKEKAMKSRLLKDLREEFSERPEEIKDNFEDDEDEEMKRLKEKLLYEEENFNRLILSKKEMKKLNSKQKLRNDLSQLDDFGDTSFLDEKEEEKDQEILDSIRKKKSINKYTSRIDQLGKRKNNRNDDQLDEMPIKKQRVSFSNQNEVLEYEETENKKRGDEFYEQVRKNMIAKRDAKMNNKLNEFLNADDDNDSENDQDKNSKRPIDYKMMKNKGLTPHRKKEARNPRVMRRMKFEIASKKLKTVRSQYKGQNKAYDGEKTGIKTNLSRSTKLE
ncbi:Sas10 domain-containing protein [Rozella allomycis CSF55]|uniref:Sas10 domain-containing protein n=1 Tax=Rozella allomycis (strain CSF55) TaxID=988480 RepID=A0A075AS09_ROZAC|nr:Sas10 domain-containing protein [Rozella allomycis CSF55]|eukprot:EPZ33023.1 Sas10 domain-containing protein [Rozella allomycis CSF55]